jgi:DNA-directed RNA polymerase subunit RPC12/RpoP
MKEEITCDKCDKEIRRYEKFYVCDRCGKRFCRMHGRAGEKCKECHKGLLEQRENR